MDAKYLVNISLAQVYFDADFNICAPPGSQPDDLTMIRHYVQMANNGVLMRREWDVGLREYSEAQREKAELYVAVS